MRPLKHQLVYVCLSLVTCTLAASVAAQTISPLASSTQTASTPPNSSSYWNDPLNWKQQFVPDSPLFWDDSRHWTTNYGPAYRDTTTSPSQFLKCSSQYALCFESGLPPLPCTLSPDGRSADCKCLVRGDANFVLESAILNYPVYLQTVKGCNAD